MQQQPGGGATGDLKSLRLVQVSHFLILGTSAEANKSSTASTERDGQLLSSLSVIVYPVSKGDPDIHWVSYDYFVYKPLCIVVCSLCNAAVIPR